MPAGGATQPADSVPLRDIPDPVQIPTGWLWFWILLGALAVAAIIWALARRLKNPKPKLVPFIPPHRWARDRLRGATELISDPYAFCSLVSDVLRQYLEQRFSLHAPDRTTEEFLEELRRSPALTEDHKGLLENFLRQCDLVKFARMEPAEPDLRALLDAALKLVDETQELAPPPPSPAQPNLLPTNAA
jgi:hypothetical protein